MGGLSSLSRRTRIGGRMQAVAQPHPPVVRTHEAIDHLDQRRLAGPVLAQQGVDLSGRDGEGHVVVGAHAGIAFPDPLGAEHVGRQFLSLRFLSVRSNQTCISPFCRRGQLRCLASLR